MNRSKKNLKRQIIGITSIILLIIAVIFIFIGLKYKHESDIVRDEALSTETNVEEDNQNVIIVKNDEKGIWDKKGETNLELNHELTIHDEEDENKIFYRVVGIEADTKGNMYVHEMLSGKIKKYSQNGNYLTTIGRRGSGPGEFLNNVAWVFGEKDSMFILDGGNQRLNYFTRKGQYLKSFQLTKSVNITSTGFARDKDFCFYVSSYNADDDKVIHKYNAAGKHIISFGMPINIKKSMTPEYFQIKRNCSHGKLATARDGIFYSQFNPYEIRKYSFLGDLKMIILRENSFMPRLKMEHVDGAVRMYMPVFSSMIGIWDEKVINCVVIPGYIESKFGCVVDVFSMDGNLLTSFYLKDRIRFYSIDQEGRLYGTIRDEEEPEKVVRYRLTKK